MIKETLRASEGLAKVKRITDVKKKEMWGETSQRQRLPNPGREKNNNRNGFGLSESNVEVSQFRGTTGRASRGCKCSAHYHSQLAGCSAAVNTD